MLAKTNLVKFLDNLVSCQITIFRPVSGFTSLDHTKQITFDVSRSCQADKVSIGKPTVYQEIIEMKPLFDRIFYHFDNLVSLLHIIPFYAFLNGCISMILTKASFKLFGSKTIRPVLLSSISYITSPAKILILISQLQLCLTYSTYITYDLSTIFFGWQDK